MFEFLKKGISTPVAIGIILVLAIFIGGVTYWQYQEMQKEELGGVEISVSEKEGVPVTEEKIEGEEALETPKEEEEKKEAMILEEVGPTEVSNTTRKGTIFRDEIWSGKILVAGMVTVPKGITLTVMPGTVIKFKYSRDYKNPEKGELRVDGGILKVIGTSEEQIWFTSNAAEPINGDWNGIFIHNSKNNNIVDHAIIEYSTMGVLFFDSSGTVANSIVRWINNEGIYMERSNPVIENNTIYGVNFNGIAMEQFNQDVVIRNNKISICKSACIHGEATDVKIENNIISDCNWGIEFDDYSNAKILGNLIENNHEGIGVHVESTGEITSNEIRNNDIGITGSLSWLFIENNDIENEKNLQISNMHKVDAKENWWGSVDRVAIDKKIESDGKISYEISEKEKVEISEPVFDYIDTKKTELGYNPGDPEDEYPYFYPLEDETRKVIKKIYGIRGGFGWSLGWDGEYLWRFRLAGGGDLVKIDPETGEIVTSFPNLGIAQPHGITFDGKSLWINDFTRLMVFEIDPDTGEILSSFKIPEMGSGASGIAWDGQYLYLVNWLKQTQLYKVDRKGNFLGILELKKDKGQTITFDGEYFWIGDCYGHKICKYDKQGNLVGWIYAVAEGTWAMTHDGKYLWTLQRTNENWADKKVYQIEILDDSLIK